MRRDDGFNSWTMNGNGHTLGLNETHRAQPFSGWPGQRHGLTEASIDHFPVMFDNRLWEP
jgi:hypothetical protein